MPCRNHSHRETRKSVWMCAESTATVIVRRGHRGTVRHASSHTEQRPKPAVQKQRGVGRMTPRAGNTFTHGGHRAAASSFQHRTQAHAPLSPRHHCRAVCKYLFSVCWRNGKKKRSTGRQISTAGWQQYMRYGPNLNNHARCQHTHPSKKKKRKTRRQGVAVCVALRVSARPDRKKTKQNKRERNVCSAPQALVARPHVTAPSARRSSRPLLMRAAGEAHRAVVMSVSVGVRVERLGGKHTAPLTGRVRKKQLKSE
ncbi:hypothetical protein TCDM_08412 [Trypanosoma cruzi Dm28c]|uniref:Uncharacterized protein n=1 Tax=Trypanosoma cruzi Dm28c TaxID=1416333 RepID=V5B7V2_TRYCR|nr:hypothetical protein TCDM_08412 [Trypanosoma cruzi Dm28c]